MVILNINSTELSLNETYFQIGVVTQLTVKNLVRHTIILGWPFKILGRQACFHLWQVSTTLCRHKISNRISWRVNSDSPRKMSFLSINRALFLHWRLVRISVHVMNEDGNKKTWRTYKLAFGKYLVRFSMELSSPLIGNLRDSYHIFSRWPLTIIWPSTLHNPRYWHRSETTHNPMNFKTFHKRSTFYKIRCCLFLPP